MTTDLFVQFFYCLPQKAIMVPLPISAAAMLAATAYSIKDTSETAKYAYSDLHDP